MTEWTSTPPSEPGKYWYKPPGFRKAQVVSVQHTGSGIAMWGPKPIKIAEMHGPWYPIPIEEPPSE